MASFLRVLRTRRRGAVARNDWLAIALLVALPICIFVPWSLAGHPVMPGDDLTQNLPLRALVGTTMRGGGFPTWDPLVFSGTPLLGGWNAGAMFPGAWLFVFIPVVAAWTINLVAVPVICATGTYVLARVLGCRPLGSSVGALAFTYAGFMSGQVVHIGLVQGSAFMPWTLVGIWGVFFDRAPHRASAYLALLGVSLAGEVLAGDPRAITSGAIVAVIYALACIVHDRRSAIRPFGLVLGGAVLGIVLSAVQWLPGLNFLHNSQRGITVYNFFASGSIGAAHLAALVLAPFLLGANGNFNTPDYGGTYNLPELTLGMGLVALVATACYLPEVCASAYRKLIGRAQPGNRKSLGVWYVLIAVGCLLTLGGTTPLGHLLVHLPLYGSERLQNRNGVIMDLGLAVLLAFFVDDFSRSKEDRQTTSFLRSDPFATPLSQALALIPLVGAIGLIVYAYAAPLQVESDLHDARNNLSLISDMSSYLIPTLVVASALVAFVLFHRRLQERWRLGVVVFLAVADVGLFVVNASYASMPSAALAASTPYSRIITSLDGPTGRFAIYDPSFYVPASSPPAQNLAGVSDLNILQNNPSVQGYGSLVQDTYEAVTATHNYEGLASTRIGGETFNTLDLKTVLTLAPYFGELLSAHGPIPVPAAFSPALGDVAPANATGPWKIAPGRSFTWTLPGAANVSRATVVVAPGSTPTVTVGFLTPHGSVLSPPPIVAGNDIHVARTPGLAVGVRVTNNGTGPLVVAAVVVVTQDPDERIALDGPLQGQLSAPHWRYVTSIGPYVAYTNSETRGFAWLQPAGSRTPETAEIAGGLVNVVPQRNDTADNMTVRADEPALLVRSETYSPGWMATLTPTSGGASFAKTVHRFGLIQAIDIPAGSYKVTWLYAPRQVFLGALSSAAGLVILILGGLFTWRRARRRGVDGHVSEAA